MPSLDSLVRSSVPLVLATMALVACESTPGSDPGDGSSSGEPTNESTAASTTTLSSSESSTSGSSVDGTGTTSTGDTETDTDGPVPEPVCKSDACSEQCTQELQTRDEQGNACTCSSAATPPGWVTCELPLNCGGLNDYPCVIEGLRDGVIGNYSWSYVIGDVGGESVLLQLLEPGRARAIEGSFEELACCGVQSRDTARYHAPFDLPAPDDPFWEACLALAPEVEKLFDAIPGCLRAEMLRVGECMAEDAFECPPGG